ncbi:hypothetical protein CRYUN_Cryun05aG0263300 [Craigia yunnanensis]
MDLVYSIKSVTKPLFRDLLISLSHKSDIPPVRCIIADGIMSFAIDVAEELKIKVIIFRTISSCCLWSYLCVPRLIEQGELPLSGNDIDQEVGSVPGMQHDHPYSFGLKQLEDPNFQFFVSETQAMTRASAVIFNTFASLEAPVLSQITPLLSKVYTIGPLHSLWKARLGHLSQLSSSNGNLMEADQNCITWLDSQPLRSVVYVSFGSHVVLTSEELLEFWQGLVNSGKRFLWTLRPDIIARARDHNNLIARELDLGLRTKENGCIVDWAPQEEVLAHPSVGGFLSHCGWNSTLESMVAGVPMICCPKLPDQLVNTRWISEVWKIGLDMKDMCDRSTVEKMVRALTEDQREEIMRSVYTISKLAHESVIQGGSSSRNLEMLIQELNNKQRV